MEDQPDERLKANHGADHFLLLPRLVLSTYGIDGRKREVIDEAHDFKDVEKVTRLLDSKLSLHRYGPYLSTKERGTDYPDTHALNMPADNSSYAGISKSRSSKAVRFLQLLIKQPRNLRLGLSGSPFSNPAITPSSLHVADVQAQRIFPS